MSWKSMLVVVGVVLFSAPVFGQELGDLGTVVITASRIAQHDYRVSSNVTVIKKEDIERSSAQNVSELLDEQLGVNVYDSGTAKTATVDIRGFGDTASRNVLILVNDRKVNAVDISAPDLIQIPLGAIERIEIIRGAGSVLYGDNAVGGVVNIITKEGKGNLSAKAGVSMGSYDTSSGDLEISGGHKGLSYYLYSLYSDSDGYRDNSDLEYKDFDSRWGYQFTDRIKVNLATTWHRDDYGMPGGLNETELSELGRRGSANPDDYSNSRDRSQQLTFDITPWPEDVELGHFVTDVSYRDRDTYAYLKDWDFGTKRMIDSYGVTTKYIYDQPILGKDFNLVTGLDFYDIDNDILGSGSNSDDLTITKKEWGIYLFAEGEVLDKTYLNVGSRLQKADYIFNQRGPIASYTTQKAKEPVTMVGGRYEYAPKSNVFFNVQQTFRFLATDEWYSTWTGLNTDLKTQTGMQYELGVKHQLGEAVSLSVTPYLINLKNEIFFDPKAGGGWGDNNNYDKTRRTGVELGQTVDLLKLFPNEVLSKWEFLLDYDLQKAEFVGGDNDGKLIPLTAQNTVGVGMNFGLWDKVGLALRGRYIGKMYAINDTLNETAPMKPYWVMDAKLSYNEKNWEGFISLNNLFDKEYFSCVTKSATSTTKDYFPAAEFNMTAGMKVKF